MRAVADMYLLLIVSLSSVLPSPAANALSATDRAVDRLIHSISGSVQWTGHLAWAGLRSMILAFQEKAILQWAGPVRVLAVRLPFWPPLSWKVVCRWAYVRMLPSGVSRVAARCLEAGWGLPLLRRLLLHP